MTKILITESPITGVAVQVESQNSPAEVLGIIEVAKSIILSQILKGTQRIPVEKNILSEVAHG